MPREQFRSKSIRDPLYGFIGLSKEEIQIIDTGTFRRLQSIKQLSHAHLAYPAAVHTRFEHSLGVAHVSDMMAKELGYDNETQLRHVRLAGLLHDIGHGPFSHLFESALADINGRPEQHEAISMIMISEDPEIAAVLDKDTRTSILRLLDKKTPDLDPIDYALSDIVSSGLDADKIDYLRRDSYHLGVKYGEFDFYRVLYNITTSKNDGGNVCIGIRGKDALENYRLARYLMHAQVYEHHARLSADQMFLRALKIAIEDGIIDKNRLQFGIDRNNSKFLDFYRSLDDSTIYGMILSNEKQSVSKDMLTDIMNRKLLKRACDFTSADLSTNADMDTRLMKLSSGDYRRIESEISQDLRLDHNRIIFYKSAIKNKLYKKGEILCRIGSEVHNFGEISPFKGDDTVRYLVFGPPNNDILERIRSRLADRFGIDSSKLANNMARS